MKININENVFNFDKANYLNGIPTEIAYMFKIKNTYVYIYVALNTKFVITMAQSPVQAQPNTDASSSSGTALGMAIGKVIGGSSSPKHVKNEQFSTKSPEQSKIPEEVLEKTGTCNEKSLAIPTSSKGGVGTNCSDGQSSKTACVGGAANTPILRQNSSSSVNSCLGTSPNPSELSNSSNLSSCAAASLNQIVDSDVQKEDHAKKKVTGNEENMEKTSCKAKSLNSGIGLASGLPITGTIKEEPADILNSLANIKKEERENLSPSISPVGFGSIGLDTSNTSVYYHSKKCFLKLM